MRKTHLISGLLFFALFLVSGRHMGQVLPAFSGEQDLSWHLVESLTEAEFDLTTCQEMVVDHAFTLPMALLWPDQAWPVKVVPICINTVQFPLPTAARCWKLGQAVGRAIRSWESDARVMVLGTGGLSHQLDGERAGFINKDFDLKFMDSLVNDPAASTYEALQARDCGSRVTMVDPNIRPGFIKDKQAHLGRICRMAAMSDIIKFSDEDLEWFGISGNHDELAAYWLGRGAKFVVVTKGAEGATGYTNSVKVSVPSERVKVVDTVGAGDTFDAGILAALKHGDLLTKARVATLDEKVVRDALSLGAKAAAVTVSRAGANPPWAHELVSR